MTKGQNNLTGEKVLSNKRIWCTMVIVVLIMSIFGVSSMMLRSTPKRIHIFQKEGKFGIKDGDSVLVPSKYLNIEFIDSISNIALLQDRGFTFQDTIFYIYDVEQKKFLFNDSVLYSISKVEKIRSDSYKLVALGGRWFATLNLPGDNNETANAIITPHFHDSHVPLKDFIFNGIGSFMMHPQGTWANMKKSSPRAFRMLEQNLAMGNEERSPDNDLTLAQAVEYFIERDTRYKGNCDVAFAEIETMIQALDNDDRDDMIQYGEIKRQLSSIKLYRSYNKMIADYPVYREEYIAWHNLIEAMTRYYHFIVYVDDWSCKKQRDADLYIGSWLDNRRSQLLDEQKILMGRKIFPQKADSLKTANDIRELCMEYYSSTPGYYNPMWHEVYYAFNEWLKVRKRISRTLPDEKSSAFNSYTSIVTDGLYNITESLYGHGLLPAK